MNSLSSRLGKITSGLTGRERAVLVLRALAAGEEPDTSLRTIDDPSQRREFDRCMGYINAANSSLQGTIHHLLYHAQWLEQFDFLELIQGAAEQSAEATGETPDPRKVKRWRKEKSINAPEFFLGIAEETREKQLSLVLDIWRQLQAVERVRGELAEEFDGVDLLIPEVREQTDDLRKRVLELAASLKGPKSMPEPEDELVEQARAQVESVFKYWRLIEVR